MTGSTPIVPQNSSSLSSEPIPVRLRASSSDTDGGNSAHASNEHYYAEQIDDRLRILSVAIELQLCLDSIANIEDAATAVAEQICETLSAAGVYLGWRAAGLENDVQRPMRIVGQSHESDASTQSETHRLLTAAIDEIALRGGSTHWPVTDHVNRHALMSVSQFVAETKSERLSAITLTDNDGDVRGVLLVLDDAVDPSVTDRLLDVLRFPILSKLQSIERSTPGRLQRWTRNVANATTGFRAKLALYASIVIAGLLCFPVQYQVRCDCELQPVSRRYIASPIDGPLEKSYVRPGDRVNQGDLIASIDAQEIEYKLAGLRAELSGITQQRNRHVVKHDFASSKISELESERLSLEMDLLEYHRGNLEIRSPIDGVVVSGDHHESIGTPLKQGETLFEIAPLGEMMIEVAVDEREFPYVDAEMPVNVSLLALPGHAIQGTIQRVHPQAELKNHQNVFIAESKIEDPENLMRPGMRGYAWVQSDPHPLGWVLFHRLYASLRSMVGW